MIYTGIPILGNPLWITDGNDDWMEFPGVNMGKTYDDDLQLDDFPHRTVSLLEGNHSILDHPNLSSLNRLAKWINLVWTI